jgi:hypothetical protein
MTQMTTTTMSLNLSAELKARLEARAAESGYATVEQYAEAVLSVAGEPQGVAEATERLLLERFDDPRPGIEFTPEFRRQFLEEVRQRRAAGGPAR